MAFADQFTMSVTVRQKGLQNLARNTGSLLDRVMRKSAEDVAGRMKQRIVMVGFVDTGATLNSIEVKRDQSRHLHYTIGPRTHYAIYGEFGTRFMAARPFARPALKDMEPRILAAVRAAILKEGGQV